MSVAVKPRINTMAFEGKDHMLRVVRGARATFYDLIDHVDDEGWRTPTACTEWEVRDVVGHMVDVSEAYLERWAIARAGKPFPEALGLGAMPGRANERAQSFRSISRPELIGRLKRASDELFALFDGLTAEQWPKELVPHVYMGPLPAFIYPAFQLMDYSVHSWDIRAGLGRSAPLTEDEAGALAPYMFILMQSTVDQAQAAADDITWGIRVSGDDGGSWRLHLKDGKLSSEEGSVAGCPVVFNFDPSDFVLTAFQRVRGGAPIGDQAQAERVRTLFFKI